MTRATARQWLGATRPRTLPAAVAPVAVGSALATHLLPPQPGWQARHSLAAALALGVALALQIGVNFANDYSDGVRGTDAQRVGPQRLVGSGAVTPATMRTAAGGVFAAATLAGLGLVAVTGTWPLLLVGATCLPAAWCYTGGPRPYGYAGWGEVVTFVYFGLVATIGTTYALTCGLPDAGWHGWGVALLAGSGCGAWACALLVVNNLRDLPRDARVGKRTLAVRLGERATRWLYVGLVTGAFVCSAWLAVVLTGWAGLALGGLPLAALPVRQVVGGAREVELLPTLALTGRAQLAWALLLAGGLLVSSWR